MNVVGLNDSNKLTANDVYDANKSKTQQTINNEIYSDFNSIIKVVDVTNSNPGTAYCLAFTAPTVDGYTFVCWVGVASNGNVGAPYVNGMQYSSIQIWDNYMIGHGITSYTAWALYRKNC